jgi:hypothetical protein
MANQLSNELIAQLFSQESADPFLTLVTLTHQSFAQPIRLVNNTKDITSRGNVFGAFPMKIRLPIDDGETAKEFSIQFDNVSLELIDEIRSVTTRIGVKLEMILASMPDVVQMSQEDLFINSITYNARSINARLVLDSFLNTEMTSERYNPKNFPGIF